MKTATDRPAVEDLRAVPTIPVKPAAAFLGVHERSLYDQLQPGGDLEHLALRIGRRVLVRTSALLALVEDPR